MYHGRSRLALAVGLALVLALGLAFASGLPGIAANGPVPRAPKPASSQVVTASGKTTTRTLSVSLQPLAAKGGKSKVDVLVILAKGSPKPASLEYAVRVRLKALSGCDVYGGKTTQGRLTKLATSKGVRFVADNGPRKSPKSPGVPEPDPKVAKAAKVTKAKQLAAATSSGVVKKWAAGFGKDGRRKAGAVLPSAPKGTSPLPSIERLLGLGGSPAAPTGSKYSAAWYDVRENHRSMYAWAKGYTGSGVHVAVPDEGVDFAHPDLQGTEATVPADAPENAGWPLAFDPFSCYALAIDDYYGTTNVQDGQTWFSATTSTVPEGPAVDFDGLTFKTDAISTPSKSGTMHIGYLNDQNLYGMGQDPDYLLPGVLVVDPNTAGVYDTVYVDLNFNGDFGDDKPCTKGDGEAPISYLDYWDSASQAAFPDGYADISGGMVYWIANGATAPPGYALEFGPMNTTPGAGDMVAFMGALDFMYDHGTLCASNVVAQGVINGPSFLDGPASLPPYKGADTGGMVQGGGKEAGLVAMGDIYKNFELSAMMAWDFAAIGPDGVLDSGDESQIVSNSFGQSEVSNSEWDLLSRYMVALNQVFAPSTTFLVSTGNGGPGYGTVTGPRPTTGVGVGASTQYGSVGYPFDSAVTTGQVVFGDVVPFSNRGPSAMGNVGADILADGAVASGDEPLNMSAGDGWTAWVSWAGTSRSCPTVAGNLSLAYQAYRIANPGQWPTYGQARGFLMNGAIDANNDTFAQGSGRLNAERSADLAAGTNGLTVSPSALTPGDWRGVDYPGYAHVIPAGGSAPATLTVTNNAAHTVTVDVEPAVYQRSKTETFAVQLNPLKMSPYRFDRPDWLSPDLSSSIPADTDLAVFRVTTPIGQMDPSGSLGLGYSNELRVLAYDWTDVNHDGVLWRDRNLNGYVDDPLFHGSEIQKGEYIRFNYSNNAGPISEVRVGKPRQRMHDGIFFGLQQASRVTSLTVTVELSCWKRTGENDLVDVTSPESFSLGSHGSSTVQLVANAPDSVGTYEAQVRVSDGATTTIVPITVNSVASSAKFSFGGGNATDTLMPNGALLGDQDWGWRPEAGDWRMFMADIPDDTALPSGAKWVVRTSWDTTPTDIDTQLWGPRPPYSYPADPGAPPFFDDPAYTDFVGPGELVRTGGSANANVFSGVWLFQTATGGPEEWVAGDLQPGLSLIQLHNVVSSGLSVATTFTGETGIMSIQPSASSLTTRSTTGTLGLEASTGLDISGFGGRGWGLTPVYDRIQPITQYEEWTTTFSVQDCAYIDAKTFNDRSDVDLILLYDDPAAGGWVPVAVSAGASGNEAIHAVAPVDGDYMVLVFGFSVTGGQDDFRARIAYPQGSGVNVSGFPTGTVDAGTTMHPTAAWTLSRDSVDDRGATWEGVAGFGPGGADQLLTSTIDIAYPFFVYASQPASDAVWPRSEPLTVDLSRRADPASVTSATAYVTRQGSGTKIPATLSYDDSIAEITLSGAALVHDAAYTIHLTSGIQGVDGTPLPATLVNFRTAAASVTRIAGSSRYDTAAQVSASTFPSAPAVVIASGESYPDALAGSGLCGALESPLLLVPSNGPVPTEVADEITRLGASYAYVVGGTGAVSSNVYEQLGEILGGGDRVHRLAGTDRYDTAAQVAARVGSIEGTVPVALIVRGDDFADALAAAPLAYARAAPVLFVKPTRLPAATSDALVDLGVQRTYLYGGTGAINTGVKNAIGEIVGSAAVTRWAGGDRYATAVTAANGAVGLGWLAWPYPGIAAGTGYPDGLAGGVASGRKHGPLLLTKPTLLPSSVAGAITANRARIDVVTIYGGTGAVSSGVQTRIEQLLQ